MLDEILKSTKQSLIDRLSSPILGGFAVSWCVLNYRFIAALFSKDSVKETLELIDGVVFPTTWSWVSRGIIEPLVAVAIYIFLYPYAARFVYGYLRKQQQAQLSLRHKIDMDTLLTVEESNNLRADINERIGEYQSRINLKNADIEALRSELATLRVENAALVKSTVKEPPNPTVRNSELSDSQGMIIDYLGDKGGVADEEDLFRNAEGGKLVQLEMDMEELRIKRYISREEKTYGVTCKLEQAGRKIYVKRKSLR